MGKILESLQNGGNNRPTIYFQWLIIFLNKSNQTKADKNHKLFLFVYRGGYIVPAVGSIVPAVGYNVPRPYRSTRLDININNKMEANQRIAMYF